MCRASRGDDGCLGYRFYEDAEQPGRFVFIDRVKHNPSFLKHIPNSLDYVAHSLSRLPELDSLREILARYLEQFRKT